MTTETIPILSGMAETAGRFDALVVDLWGVVHDGLVPYPGAVDCLLKLRRSGVRICLLSNAPRRTAAIRRRLDEMGVPRDAYDAVMSSGEATHHALRDRPDDFHRAIGDRIFHLGPDRDRDVFETLPFVECRRPDEASFVLATGIESFDETVEDHRPTLDACCRAALPMVCANPDLVVFTGGRFAICAGLLAQEYERMGGRVFWHGKPHRPVYEAALALLGNPEPSRTAGVGDSFRTDVAGASAAGLTSIFVVGGIHKDELQDHIGRPDPHRILAMGDAEGVRPDLAIPALEW